MNYIKAFIQSESSGGIMLLLAAILGVITANSPLAEQYFALMHVYWGPMDILEWVNDGLMALFFLYVGLEIKSEMISGELNTNSKRVLPLLAAFAGVVTPALVYFLIAGSVPEYTHGWGIPTATDIAFAIGVKVIFLLLAAIGFSTMWEAVFADVGVTVLCIINAMRNLQVENI